MLGDEVGGGGAVDFVFSEIGSGAHRPGEKRRAVSDISSGKINRHRRQVTAGVVNGDVEMMSFIAHPTGGTGAVIIALQCAEGEGVCSRGELCREPTAETVMHGKGHDG